MKVRIIQPLYSADYARSDELFEQECQMLRACDESLDLIVCPEACDVPALARTKEQFEHSVNKYNAPLLSLAAETARRCHALLFINAIDKTPTGWRNTTFAFDRQGNPAGTYDKQHLTPGEVNKRRLDSDYTFEFSEPTVLTIEGIRFAFLTCYDFYFYEAFAHIARKKVDVIIGCSHQRSDLHSALETMTRFLAYNTNAWVLRSSVSMGEEEITGGCSMIVSPKGEVIANLYSRVGWEDIEIDVTEKYFKPAGYGNPPAAHYEYIEQGRRPWKYRPAGSAIVKPDDLMPYPRVCAHRGFNTIAPENSMPAFGAAVAMGAEEIEFDLWYTKDGEIVSIHDADLDRVSDGTGKVYEHTYEELLRCDFGCKYGERFKGLRILKFEEILQKFAGHVIMNIHVKTVDNDCTYDENLLLKIVSLIEKYDCVNHVYFMTGNDHVLQQMRALAPQIRRCVGGGKDPWGMVERAIRFDCPKIQLVKGKFDQAMIDRAREKGIILNVFWSDDPEETKKYLDMGIDVILTNDYQQIAEAVRQWKAEK